MSKSYKFINRKVGNVLIVFCFIIALIVGGYSFILRSLVDDVFGGSASFIDFWLFATIALPLFVAWIIRVFSKEKHNTIDRVNGISQHHENEIPKGKSLNVVFAGIFTIVGIILYIVYSEISQTQTDENDTDQIKEEVVTLEPSSTIEAPTKDKLTIQDLLESTPLIPTPFDTQHLSIEDIENKMSNYSTLDSEMYHLLNLGSTNAFKVDVNHNLLGKVVYGNKTGLLISQIGDNEVFIKLVIYDSSNVISDFINLFFEDSAYKTPMYSKIRNEEIFRTFRETDQHNEYNDLYFINTIGRAIGKIKSESLPYSEDDLSYHEGDAPWNENFEPIGDPIAIGKTLASKNNSYHIKNIMDYDISTAWVEGEEGQGIGSEFGFKVKAIPNVLPQTLFRGNCYIANGYYKTQKTWDENSRVKTLQAYLNNTPFAIITLNDFRGVQTFNLSPFYRLNEDETNKGHLPLLKENDILSFEILEVYPGTKYEETAISEFFTDGVMY